MTIERQIIDLLYSRCGVLFCHRCIRRNLIMPAIAEIGVAPKAIARAATFGCGDAECSECHGTRHRAP
jgi:hypothetical protein